MPSSEPDNIPLILHYVRSVKPASILDVGCGCGKYGMLFREYLDGHWTGRAFHDKSTWKTRIVGLDIFAAYLTPVHQYVYDEVFIADYLKFNSAEQFDLILFGDVVEHFELDVAKNILAKIASRLTPKGSVVVSTPNFETRLDRTVGAFGNVNECHRCRLYKEDFQLPGFRVVSNANRLLTVFMERLG